MSDVWGGGRCRTGSGCGGHSKTMHARAVMVIVDGMCGVLSYRQGAIRRP